MSISLTLTSSPVFSFIAVMNCSVVVSDGWRLASPLMPAIRILFLRPYCSSSFVTLST